MNEFEIITLSIALLSLSVSIITLIIGKKRASAMIELAISERITSTKEKVSDVTNIMTPIVSKTKRNQDDENMIVLYGKQLDLAIENNINAYEEACAKYLDNKVDKIRFKKLYKNELRKLVEHNELKKYFDGVSSDFKAIIKVYTKWEDLEQ